MKIRLSFTSKEGNKNALMEVAGKHGLDLKRNIATSGIMNWTIITDIDIADLCNFINEVGYNDILITASKRRHSKK